MLSIQDPPFCDGKQISQHKAREKAEEENTVKKWHCNKQGEN
jgi:hypothetical protein